MKNNIINFNNRETAIKTFQDNLDIYEKILEANRLEYLAYIYEFCEMLKTEENKNIKIEYAKDYVEETDYLIDKFYLYSYLQYGKIITLSKAEQQADK